MAIGFDPRQETLRDTAEKIGDLLTVPFRPDQKRRGYN